MNLGISGTPKRSDARVAAGRSAGERREGGRPEGVRREGGLRVASLEAAQASLVVTHRAGQWALVDVVDPLVDPPKLVNDAAECVVVPLKKRLLADLHRRDRLQERTLLVDALGEVVEATGEVVEATGEVGPGRTDFVTDFTKDGEREAVLFHGCFPRVRECT